MSNNAVAREKYLINCQDGANNPERATISFILAFTASKTCETAVSVSVNIAQLSVKGGAAALRQKAMSLYWIYSMVFWTMAVKPGSVQLA